MTTAPRTGLAPGEADIVSLPSQLDFPAFLMNFPFTIDNRAANNALMDHQDPAYNRTRAFNQFMALYAALAKEALVYLLPSGGDYQDLPFVANLGLCPPHRPQTMVLSNFTSPPRKGEAEVGRDFFTQMGYEVIQPPDKWEGEADLKFIRDALYVGGTGQRSTRQAFDWIADRIGAEIVQIALNDEKLYHLDCSFFPIDGDRALMATAAFDKGDVAAVEKVVDIVDVPRAFIHHGWTNGVRLGDTVLCAKPPNLKSERELVRLFDRLGLKAIMVDLSEYAKSGGDLSCLVCHLNYRNRGNRRESGSKRKSPLYHLIA